MESEREANKESPERSLPTETSATNDSSNDQVFGDIEARRREASKLRARRNRKRKKEESLNLENHVKNLSMRNMELERQLEVMKVQLVGAEEKIKTLEKLLSDTLKAPQTQQAALMGRNMFPDNGTYMGNPGLNNMSQYCSLYPMNVAAYGTLPSSSAFPTGSSGLATYDDLNGNEMLMQAIMGQQQYLSQQHLDRMYKDPKPRKKRA